MAKINDEQLKHIPVSFSKIKEYESDQTDNRFTEVLIKILHLGRNYNGSIFKREVVEQAIPTLANTPILGFIEPNKQGEDDFSDHRMELVNKNGTLDMKYMGHAYGVISESQSEEAYFEDELCSDGIVRTYLYVKGLLFNKFDYVIDMFKSHDGTYNQSMELSDNYIGSFNADEGGFVFDSFQFDGACIITCAPAMIDSEITTNFSQNNSNIAKEIENKLNEFAKYFSKKEEQENMAKKKMEDTTVQDEAEVKNNSKSQKSTEVGEEFKKDEQVDNDKEEEFKKEKTEVDTEMACGDKKENMSEIDISIEDEDEVCPECGHNPCTCEEDDFAKKSKEEEPKEEMACGDNKKYTINFSLSHEDVRNELYNKLWDMGNIENTYYCIIKTMDNYFIYCDCMNGQFFEQAYAKTEDSVVFAGERKEVFDIFVDKETKDAMTSVTYSKLQKDLEEANKKIVDYSKANEELLKFQIEVKENERKSEIDGVISNFSTVEALDLENYRQKAYNKELDKDQLEEKLYALVGKMNFSKKVETKTEEDEIQSSIPTSFSVSIKNSEEQSKCPYEGCESLFYQK